MTIVLLRLFVGFADLLRRDEGQDLVENALMLALISCGAVAILSGIGNAVVGTLTAINSAL
jgi:Flp pilus assembly pilin Flp